MIRELFRLANLLSLSRILLAPFIGYFLWKGDSRSTLICVGLLTFAGITDFFDGWLARRLNQVSRLGMVLDPVADKVLAVVLVVMLIFFRGLPLWLAAVIVGRDLLIVVAGAVLLRGNDIVFPSNVTGKYTFVSIVVLLASFIIRYEFGIMLMTYVAVSLIIISTFIYAKSFILARKGFSPTLGVDRPMHKIARVAIAIAVSALYCYKLYMSK
jgi:cardiolipin synthase